MARVLNLHLHRAIAIGVVFAAGLFSATGHPSDVQSSAATATPLNVQSNLPAMRSVDLPPGAAKVEVFGDSMYWVARTEMAAFLEKPKTLPASKTTSGSGSKSRTSPKTRLKTNPKSKTKSEREASKRVAKPPGRVAKPPGTKPSATMSIDHLWTRRLPRNTEPSVPTAVVSAHPGVNGDVELLTVKVPSSSPPLDFKVAPSGQWVAYAPHLQGDVRELDLLEIESKKIRELVGDSEIQPDDELKILGWSSDSQHLWLELQAVGRVKLAVVDPSQLPATPPASGAHAREPVVHWQAVDASFVNGSSNPFFQLDHGWLLDLETPPLRVFDVSLQTKAMIPVALATGDEKIHGARWTSDDRVTYDLGVQKLSVPAAAIAASLRSESRKTSLLAPDDSPRPMLSGSTDLIIPRTPNFSQIPGSKISLFSTAFEFARLSAAAIVTSASGLQRESEEFLPRRHLNEAVKACGRLKSRPSQSRCLQLATMIATGHARLESGKLFWKLNLSNPEPSYLADYCQAGAEVAGLSLFRACVYDHDALVNYAYPPNDKPLLADFQKKAWFCTAAQEARDELTPDFYKFRDAVCDHKNYAAVGVPEGPCTTRLFGDEGNEAGLSELVPEMLCRLFSVQASNQELAARYLSHFAKSPNVEAVHRYLLTYSPLGEEAARSVVKSMITWQDPATVSILTSLLEQRTNPISQRVAIAGFADLRDPRTLPILEAYLASSYGSQPQRADPVRELISLLQKK